MYFLIVKVGLAQQNHDCLLSWLHNGGMSSPLTSGQQKLYTSSVTDTYDRLVMFTGRYRIWIITLMQVSMIILLALDFRYSLKMSINKNWWDSI